MNNRCHVTHLNWTKAPSSSSSSSSSSLWSDSECCSHSLTCDAFSFRCGRPSRLRKCSSAQSHACTCSSRVHHVFFTCSSRVHHVFFTCSSHVHHVFITCSSRVHHMYITCSSRVLHVFITCSSRVLHMFITCTSRVHHVFSLQRPVGVSTCNPNTC